MHGDSGLNVENAEGMVASVLDWIVRERDKNQAAKRVTEKQLADGHNIQRNIKDIKCNSAAEFIAGLKEHQDKENTMKIEKT